MTLETELTVNLNHEDIADIAEVMNNQLSDKDKVGQGYMEWLLCDAIKKIRNVNFFVKQRKISTAEDMMEPDIKEIVSYKTSDNIVFEKKKSAIIHAKKLIEEKKACQINSTSHSSF